MNPRKIINFLLQERHNIYSLSKQSTEDYVTIFNYCKSKGLLMPAGNDYCRSADADDMLESDLSKPMDIKILEYLEYEKARFNKIEIAAPFIFIDDSMEQRVNVWKALDYLAKDRLIELDGHAPSLAATMAGSFGSKFITGLKASITKAGEKEIEPKQENEVSSVQNNYHGNFINAPVTQSDFSNSNDNSLHTHNTTNIAETKKAKRSKIEIIYWVVGIIVGLIVIYEYLHKINFVLKF